MSRRKTSQQRTVLPDFKFGSKMLSKFINILMVNGKKSTAENIVYCALNLMFQRVKKKDVSVFYTAIKHVSPIVEVKSRRVGGATYQVPVEVRVARRHALAIRWIIQSARRRKEKSMSLKLANELSDAFFKQGLSVKKREEMHRIAESNKAFAHYRW